MFCKGEWGTCGVKLSKQYDKIRSLKKRMNKKEVNACRAGVGELNEYCRILFIFVYTKTIRYEVLFTGSFCEALQWVCRQPGPEGVVL